MSKGPGQVERAIEAILVAEPDNAFTVDDLCDRVYRGVNRIEKKHRVSIMRAAKSVAKRRDNLEWFRSEHLGGTLVFFMADSVTSYAMARLKVHTLARYRNNDKRQEDSPETEQDLRAKLQITGAYFKHILPGGEWWDEVELWKAERAGDAATVAELRAKARRRQGDFLRQRTRAGLFISQQSIDLMIESMLDRVPEGLGPQSCRHRPK